MRWIGRVLSLWLPHAALAVVLSGTIYVAVQQSLRSGANDPQIQMAEDAARELGDGSPAASVTPSKVIDVSRSLAPFAIVYDDAGVSVASSGQLSGSTPALPTGVLDYVRRNGHDRITWEPAAGVRIAAVIERVSGPAPGFVLAGRSLREVEIREANIEWLVAAGLALSLITTLLVAVVVSALVGVGSSGHGEVVS